MQSPVAGAINRCAWQPALFFRLSTGLALRRIISGMAGKAARRDAVYRFWPTYWRYPGRILGADHGLSTFRVTQSSGSIASQTFSLSAEITTLGKRYWQEKFAAPLILRLDKEGAWYFNNDASGCIPAYPTQIVIPLSRQQCAVGGVLAGLASGLPLADAVLLGNAVASWVVGHGAVVVANARTASSHTKTSGNLLRQWRVLSIGRCCWSSATCLIPPAPVFICLKCH